MRYETLKPCSNLFRATSAIVAQDTTSYYYDAAWKETSVEKASYYRKKFKTTGGWGVVDYYASGQVQMKGSYINDSCSIKSGEFKYYNRKGTITHSVSYLNDKPEGPEAYYDENGQNNWRASTITHLQKVNGKDIILPENFQARLSIKMAKKREM